MKNPLQSIGDHFRERLAVFENVQYRLMLFGRSVSFLGDGFFTVASMWLVYELTGSTLYTGIAGFLFNAPSAVKFLVGPVIDRVSLRRVLTLSEFAQAIVVVLVPIAAATGHLNVYLLLAVMPFMAIGNVFAAPAQNAALPRIVEERLLVSANSMFSVATQLAETLSRSIAGLLITLVGGVALYAIDGATFVLAGLLFYAMSIPDRDREDDEGDSSLDLEQYKTELAEGLDVLRETVAGQMLTASLFMTFMSGVTYAVLPAFADQLGGPELYGLLLTTFTVGSVLGSLSATAVDHLPLGLLSIGSFVLGGVLWIAGVLTFHPVWTLGLIALSRIPLGVYNVSIVATFQTGVPDELLGRVTSTTSSASNVTSPVGMVVGGFLGTYVAERLVVLAVGGGYLLTALYWLLVPRLRTYQAPTEMSSGEFAPETTPRSENP